MRQTVAYGEFDREFDDDTHEWTCSQSRTHTVHAQLGGSDTDYDSHEWGCSYTLSLTHTHTKTHTQHIHTTHTHTHGPRSARGLVLRRQRRIASRSISAFSQRLQKLSQPPLRAHVILSSRHTGLTPDTESGKPRPSFRDDPVTRCQLLSF